jgi:hypothetical protein
MTRARARRDRGCVAPGIPARSLGALASALAAALAGCGSRPGPGLDGAPAPRPAEVEHASVTRAVFRMEPLGVVPFAGPMLPVSSPSGEYLAVPQGAPVPWPLVLAEPGAQPDQRSRLRVYSLRPLAVTELPWSASLPKPLVLGRNADDEGFLVEAPQPDGARWIGKVAWADGTLTWLVQGTRVNTHAVLAPGRRLVCTQRPVDDFHTDIVVHTLDTPGAPPTRITPPDGAVAFAAWLEGDRIAAVLVTASGLDLVGFSLGPDDLGAVQLRRTIAPAGVSPGLAYQVLAAHQPPLVTDTESTETAIFDPAARAMTSALDPKATVLDAGTIAAARTRTYPGNGWLVTSRAGLHFRPSEAIAAGRPDRIKISDVAFLPRLTSRPGLVVLLGPSAGSTIPSVQILMLDTTGSPPSPVQEPRTGQDL